MDCSRHGGHRYYRGGRRDGEIDHLVNPAPGDFFFTMGTILRDGQRSWYERDDLASNGTEVVYQFLGLGRRIEDCRRGAS
jgi:hypothetical protein